VEGATAQVLRCREEFGGATRSALLGTYLRATDRERMHFGSLCLTLIGLMLRLRDIAVWDRVWQVGFMFFS
jgi:hypothetical protein